MRSLDENSLAGRCLQAAKAMKPDGAHQALRKAIADKDISADHADRMLMAVRQFTATCAAAETELMLSLSTMEG